MTVAITDFTQFTGLRAAAERDDPAALRNVASQFEALFLQSMLKNMREASLGDDLFGNSDQLEMFQGMLDQQMSLEMANGKGVGLADVLVRQLSGNESAPLSRPDAVFPLTTGTRMESLAETVIKPWSDANSFAQDVWPHAKRAGKKLNVSPELIVAQAALETGWGAHVMPDDRGASSLNLFGIKANTDWRGAQVRRPTLEFEDGTLRPQQANFRSYRNIASTFDDYTEFLGSNPRYSGVLNHGSDTGGFARALQDSGYATDPNYAQKLMNVLQSPTMRRALASIASVLKNSSAPPITAALSENASSTALLTAGE